MTESCDDHSRAGASNAISTPSKPWRSSSRLSSERSVSSRSASMVLSGTDTTSAIGQLTLNRYAAHVGKVSGMTGLRIIS